MNVKLRNNSKIHQFFIFIFSASVIIALIKITMINRTKLFLKRTFEKTDTVYL